MLPIPIMTRRQASNLGLRRYYTGRSCMHGHDSQRYTISGACIVCARNAQREYVETFRGNRRSKAVTVHVHPDDVGQITDLAAALNGGRDAALAGQPFDARAAQRAILGRAARIEKPLPRDHFPHGKPSD